MSEQKICPTCGTEYPLSERFCPRDGSALRSTGGVQGDLVGTIIDQKFHILKKLGEGGMGTVYLAEHVKMGRKAALKVMNPGMSQDADAIARFNREAANASRLNHPNICGIYDFGETPEGLIFLAMEFIEGVSLTSLIEQSGALAAPRAASIIHQAADALQVAHDYGIVHRDLKPDNIMIAKSRDGSDQVKVVDFGIAKASSSDAQKVTKTGLVVGTPEYMSPEQLAGDKLDGRSDIYSLALVAFNTLTGTLPFPSNSVQEAMIMRLTDKPKTLAEMKPGVEWPEQLQTVMDRALARDVGDRYQSAAEFGRDMARAVQDMPQSVAAGAATQVIGATPAAASAKTVAASAAAVPKTRVASSPAEAGVAVAAAPARSKMPMVLGVAALVVAGVGFGALKIFGGPDTGATTSKLAQAPTAAESTKAAGSGGANPVTPPPPLTNQGKQQTFSNPMKQDPGAGRSQTGTPPLTPGTAAPVAAPDFMVTWKGVFDGEEFSAAEARKLIAEIRPITDALGGERQGNAYYLLGVAHLKLEQTAESCVALRKARPNVKGNVLALTTTILDGNCQ